MWATIAFLIIFVFMMPKIRDPLLQRLGGTGDWIVKYAPYSFIVLALFLAATIAALVLMIKWPGVVEPENPLAKYKKENVETD